MGAFDILKKDLSIFPPYMIEGNGFIIELRKIYLQFTETLSALIVIFIFINYIFFCQNEINSDNLFRIFNITISSIITFDITLKMMLILPLYKNKYYYGLNYDQNLFLGKLFILFDFLSGPVSLIIDLITLSSSEKSSLNLADIFILLRIFCLERIRFLQISEQTILRLLIKDVFHILYVARYINLSLALTFYVYSYLAYRIFQIISPKYFRNVFISMLSMFQVLTLDSWNQQVNQSVAQEYGQIWSIFFIFFIIFMFFYFINLLLGAFVSYYSNPNLRMNFDYDYGHDDILNPELNEEFKQTEEISSALKTLNLKEDNMEQVRNKWGLGQYEFLVFCYVLIQIIMQIVDVQNPCFTVNLVTVIFEEFFGILYCYFLIIKAREFKDFKDKENTLEQIEEITIEEKHLQDEEQSIRLYILILLTVSGPVALIIDVIYLAINYDTLFIQYGPACRIFIILAIQCVQKAIFKFVEVLPGVSHIILFIAGLLFSLCLIGHQFLADVNPTTFGSMTDTYLFLLQVITFDSWGDIARNVIKEKGFLYVIYFLFLTVFIGFFLLNMLVGIMATMTQPKTQELFEKEHILRQRVNRAAVNQLKDQIEIYQQSQADQREDEIANLKQLLDDFNSSNGSEDKLYVYIGGEQFEITTRNFLVFDDDQ